MQHVGSSSPTRVQTRESRVLATGLPGVSSGCSFERRAWKLGFLKLTALGPEFTHISHQGRQRKQTVGTIQPGTDTVRDAVNGGKDRRRGLGPGREAGRQLRRGERNNGGKGKKGFPTLPPLGWSVQRVALPSWHLGPPGRGG